MKRTRYLKKILASQRDAHTMGKLLKRLVCVSKFAEIERLLTCLPNTQEYNNNEDITRAKIALAWNKKEVQTVYRLIEEGNFSHGEDLIELWDEAHYYEAKCQNPVQRYRLRQRFLPPQSICPSGVRKKRGIPKDTSDALQAWFTQHGPYPTETERLMLARKHRLTLVQLKSWFANARRRLRKKTTECPDNLRKLGKRCKLEEVTVEESETCSPLSSSELTPGQQTDVTTLAGQSVSWETPWKIANVAPSTDESNTPLFPSEIPCKEEDITHLVDQSVSPPLHTSNTPYKLDHVSSLADQSGPPFQSETPWKLADVIPSLDQPYSHDFLLSEPEAVFPPSTESANTAPTVTWNSGFSFTRLNSIGGAPFAPYVATGGHDQLPWLHNVLFFPPIPASAISFNGFPAGLLQFPCAGANLFHDIGEFQQLQVKNLETEVPASTV